MPPWPRPTIWRRSVPAARAGSAGGHAGYVRPADPHPNTEIIRAFAARMEARDWEAFATLLDPDVVYEVPQTRERIRGRDQYVQFNAEYPGDWHVEPKVILADDTDGSLLFVWTLGDDVDLAIAFFELADGHITKITDFWPEPYEPPSGREHLVERW